LKQPAPVVTPPPVVPVHPGKPVTIEDVLDELLARKITRDEAAARIRAIDTPGSSLISSTGTVVHPSTGGS
jgi:hypothetical protein